MKILAVCQYYYPEPLRITDICESLVARGHSVTVLTGLPNYPEGRVLKDYRNGKRREETINGVRVTRCFEIGRGSSRIRLFFNYFSFTVSSSIKAFFLKEQFDVIFTNQLSPVMMGIPAIIYKKRMKKKMLLYCLDLWPESLSGGGIKEGSIIYRTFLQISKWIYNSADTILITSNMFAEYFKDVLQLNAVRIKHLPQYAEDIFNNNSPQVYGDTENKILSTNKIYNFVFAGNIGDGQSVDTIINAASELNDDDNVIFHIVGSGSKLNQCKMLANNLKLKSVIFHGRKPIEEMPRFYNMADAMLITLKNSRVLSLTLPGKVQSYMAAGKPIIAAVNGETFNVISKAGCGYVCPAEDSKALAELFRKFFASEEIIKMGINARKFYEDNYSKENFLRTLENELFELEG